MKTVRLLLFVLAVLMDLGDPLLPGTEGFERLAEAAHGGRRLVRLLREASPAPAAAAAAKPTPTPPRRALRRPPVPPSVARPRKAPPPLADPATASDDH